MENIPFRIGHGYDVHRLVEGRKLIMGGVEIPYEKGLLGHSDADVLLHAVSDALLGALALGDIGKHFPDTDPAYAGADSLKLLELVVEKVKAQGYAVGNLDATILCQKPKLAPYIVPMREKIAAACGVSAGKGIKETLHNSCHRIAAVLHILTRGSVSPINMQRGEKMLECKAAMVSYTQANRARQALQQHGISSEIRRLEHLGPEGCGFVLAARADCGRVSALLSREGIPFRSPLEGRDMR